MEPTEVQYLIVNALETLELLQQRTFDGEIGNWYIRTLSPVLPIAMILPSGDIYCTYKLDIRAIREPTQLEKQQYQRMIELSDLARQRYLEVGGDPQRPADEKYMTEEEKEEFFELGKMVFGVQVSNGEVYCQGRSM